jgi:hypothetical protein
MKNIQKIKRVKLKVNLKEKFLLLGIVSSEPDYRISLALNKKLRISLKNITPLKITDDPGNELTFSRFSYTGGSSQAVFNLISNRSGNSFLIKKLKNVDYVFQIHSPDCSVDQITSCVRETEFVNAVFHIEIDTLKDKNFQYLIQ